MTLLRKSGGGTFFGITIEERRNPQERRMAEAMGSKVLKLMRVKIGPIEIGRLQIGKHRPLTAKEVQQLAGGGCVSARRQRRSRVGNSGVELAQGPASGKRP